MIRGERPAILAIDMGTTASKAAVFSLSGRMLSATRAPLRTRFGPRGRAEQEPDALLSTQRLAIRRALAACGARVIAAGVASQRSTFVVWDRATGRPLAPAPTWQDTSAADRCAHHEGSERFVRRLTGLPLSPHYSASKLAALLERTPGARRRAERGDLAFGSVATWLLWSLSGGRVHAVDPTLAARTLLFDVRALRWDDRLLDLFGVPSALLPEVRPSLGDFGSIRIAGEEVPVLACLGDQQAALHATAGDTGALVNYGTGAFVLIPTGGEAVRREGLLTSLAWTSDTRRRYLLEGTVNAAGAALDWLRRELGAPATLAGVDRLCRRASGRTAILPAFWGLGSLHGSGRDRSLPSLALELPPRGALADLTRAAVESIAHQVAEILERAAPSGRPTGSLLLTGGLARLRHLVEFQAALLPGMRVAVGRQSEEATLRGAARAAGEVLPRTGRRVDGWRALPARPVRVSAAARRSARGRHEQWLRLLELARGWERGAGPRR